MATPLRDMEAEISNIAQADNNKIWPVLWFRCPKCKDTELTHHTCAWSPTPRRERNGHSA